MWWSPVEGCHWDDLWCLCQLLWAAFRSAPAVLCAPSCWDRARFSLRVPAGAVMKRWELLCGDRQMFSPREITEVCFHTWCCA